MVTLLCIKVPIVYQLSIFLALSIHTDGESFLARTVKVRKSHVKCIGEMYTYHFPTLPICIRKLSPVVCIYITILIIINIINKFKSVEGIPLNFPPLIQH